MLKSVNKTLFKSTVSLYLLQAAKYIFPLVTIPYLTRVLGSDAYGIRGYELAVMSSVQLIADFGFTNYGIFRLSKCLDDKKAVSEVLSSILVAKVLLLGLLAVGMTCLCWFTPILRENLIYTIIAFAAVSFTSLLPDFVFRAFENMQTITLRFVLSKGIATVLVFVLVHSPSELLVVPELDLLAALIAFCWSWKIVLCDYQLHVHHVKIGNVGNDLKQSALYFVSGASSIIFSSLTTFLFGLFNGNLSEIAYWSLAGTILSMADALCGPLTNALYPNLLKSSANSLPGIFRRLFKISLPILVCAAALLAIFNKQVALLLGGADYLSGSYVFALISPVIVFTFYSSLLGWPALGATGHINELNKTTFISIVVHLAFLLVMAIVNGYILRNVALTLVISSGVLCATRFLQCKKLKVI